MIVWIVWCCVIVVSLVLNVSSMLEMLCVSDMMCCVFFV